MTDFGNAGAALERVYQAGYQPYEIVHLARKSALLKKAFWSAKGLERSLPPMVAALILRHADASDGPFHPAWAAQNAALSAEYPQVGSIPFFGTADVETFLQYLVYRPLGVLVPIPGHDHVAPIVTPPPLSLKGATSFAKKIAALLAKAASTQFKGEAEAFYEKAAQLSEREGVAGVDDTEGLSAKRVPVIGPHVGAKFCIWAVVAQLSRCEVVQHQSMDLVTVMGDPVRILEAEVLYRELLAQAEASFLQAKKGGALDGRSKSAFLKGFAFGVVEKWKEAERATGTGLVCVSMDQDLKDLTDRVVGKVVMKRTHFAAHAGRLGTEAGKRSNAGAAKVSGASGPLALGR